MAELKILNEFGFDDVLLALEPARQCACHCVWCAPQLNRRGERFRNDNHKDVGQPTFERTVNRAFGPGYDPADFLQWGLRNRLPMWWATTVEPFQDVRQASAILDVIDRLDLPVVVQTRGTNWREVWPRILDRAGNIALYVSIATDDPAVVRRFEPGSPPLDDRWALIEAAGSAGIPVMLGIAPAHAEWAPPRGWIAPIERAASCGAKAVLFDPLHLNPRQRLACKDPETIRLADSAWSDELVDIARDALDACTDLGLGWWTVDWRAPLYRLETWNGYGWQGFRNATRLPYYDDRIFEVLYGLTVDDDGGPVVVTWEDALGLMEAQAAAEANQSILDRRFSWGSLRNFLRCLKDLPPSWQDHLKPAAPLRDYFRALWNNPGNGGFFWRHPFVRLASHPTGKPWVTAAGDVVAIYDPDYEPTTLRRVVEDDETVRVLDPIESVSPDPLGV